MKKNNYSGKFIVFEGLDGSGGETQTNLLFNYFKRQKKSVEKLTYPDYSRPIGQLIHKYLYKKCNFSTEVQFLIYFSDFVKDKEKIKKFLKEGKIVISDRYFTSTLAYQGLRGFPIKEALNLANIFKIPQPDLTFYLEISPKTSLERKLKEKINLDRNEADKKFLEKLTKFYQYLIKHKIFCNWITVNGEKSKEEVFFEIKNIVLSNAITKEKEV